MRIEILIIGSELLWGRMRDSNGHYIARRLYREGLKTEQITVIPDQMDVMVTAITKRVKRCDLTIVSGGLGPTKDDITKDALCKAFNLKLLESSEATEIVSQNYKRLEREWDNDLNNYHKIPQGVIPLVNPKGLAPGLLYIDPKSKHAIAFLPGVPREFESMCEDILLPRLKKLHILPSGHLDQFIVRTRFVPEEKIFGEIDPTLWNKLEHFGTVSSLPHVLGVDIIINIHKKIIDTNWKEDLKKIFEESPIKSAIWHFDDSPLMEVIFSEAHKKQVKFSFAESASGGLLSSRATDISGASLFLKEGLVTYSNDAKVEVLGVPRELLVKYGAVSSECAHSMAQNLLRRSRSEIAVVITGVAGPLKSENKEVGTLFVGIASKHGIKTFRHKLAGDRLRLKERFAEMALFHLLDEIRAY